MNEGPRLQPPARGEGSVLSEVAQAVAAGDGPRAVVLVEGVSDRNAVAALARRRRRDLVAERISIVSLGGATNLGRFLDLLRDRMPRLAGLCDEAEEGAFARALQRAGLGASLTRTSMERLGFFVCVTDLEDELIRALGTAAVERIIDSQNELGSLRLLQQQPAQRGRTHHDQLLRFMGSRSGRKARYGRLMVEALDLSQMPRPLEEVLASV